MDTIEQVINIIFRVVGLLTFTATIIARITKNKKDDAFVSKLVKMLPTIGINPRTKK